MILRIDRWGTELPPPSDPDPQGAKNVQELMGGRFVEPPPPLDPEKCWDSGLRVDEGKPSKTVPGKARGACNTGGKGAQ